VASNDRGRRFQGQALGIGCLAQLPNMGFDRDTTSQIALIDVIGFDYSAPRYAFEVETTTSIYSGLLRLSDLVARVPAINIKLFIVAPLARRDKVKQELERPTFRQIGLSRRCRFISTEALDTLRHQVSAFAGHVQPSIIDTIAVPLVDEPGSALR
jgi:hypothetical protein